MTTPIRKIVIGENHRSVAVLNRPVEDILSGSGYSSGGEDFAGFSTVAALAAEATARGAGDTAAIASAAAYTETQLAGGRSASFTRVAVPAVDGAHAAFNAGGSPDSAVVQYGTAGTLSGVTASTTNTSSTIGLSVGHGIANGAYVTIAGMVGAFVLSGVGATSATLNRAATATLAGAVVQYIQKPDPTLYIGYNPNRLDKPAEPEWGSNWEADYLDTDGYRKMEHYLQFASASATFRPFFAQANRDLNTLAYAWVLAGNAGGFQVNKQDGSQLLQIDASLAAFQVGVKVNAGGLGVGITPAASTAAFVSGTVLTGVTQYGARVEQSTSTATTLIGVYGAVSSAAVAFTLNSAYALYAGNGTRGAGSTITFAYGLYVDPITIGNTANFAIYTAGTESVSFGGTIAMRASVSQITPGATSFAIRNNGNSANNLLIVDSGVATFRSTVVTAASVTGAASLNLPHGAAPTAPVNGDMWTTTAGLFVRINGTTVGPLT